MPQGRVEVKHDGVWGTVCDDEWDTADAIVVCRSLGFGTDGAIDRHEAYPFGQGSGTIWMDNLGCSGSEAQLSDCPFNGWGSHNCGHSEECARRNSNLRRAHSRGRLLLPYAKTC